MAEEKKSNEREILQTGEFKSLPQNAMREKTKITERTPTQLVWRNKVYLIDQSLMRIGRAPQNEIVIDATGVSRFHCQIKRQDKSLILEDLGSTNGTFLNGKLLKQAHTLRDGDIIYICDQRITFQAN